MDALTAGDIVPGERIGLFHLGMPWHALAPQLPISYERHERHDCFVVQLPAIWFFISADTQQLDQITVRNPFQGRIAGVIGLGSTGTEVAKILGTWVEDADDTLVIPEYPGVCFEVAFVDGQSVDWQMQDAPIAFISVYQPNQSTRIEHHSTNN